ncbi:MAG: CoA transferase [Actinomycetota bacterium]|nr:CoA transferase [Actinomycetota bacterium]
MTGLAQARPSLAGVRVLDLTRLLPGNYATLLLYGLGAEVIKVEELTGDGTRAAPPYSATGESGANLVLNRGKTSLALDLKTDEGRALLLRLIASAEVMMDSFRPGVLDRLGLGAAAVAAANPRLVHVSLTAFGDDGPYVRLPTHDLNVQALGGILSLSTDDAGRPSMPALQAADLATGLQAALAVLAGLRAVAQDGQGYRAQVAMADAALALTPLAAGHLAAGTGSMPAGRDLLTGALACYGVYRCADDRWLAVGALEPKFFGRLCELIEHPEFAARQYDLAGQAGLRADLAEVFGARPRAAWVELLAGEDTCVTPVNNLAEAFADANAVERGVIVEARRSDGGAAPVVRAVPWLAEESGAHVTDLGSDAEAILTAVGLDAATVADLRARGIVGGSP